MAGRELRDDRGGEALTSTTTATTSTANSNTTTTTTTSTAASLDEITVASPASGEGLGSRPERAAAQLCQLKLKYEYAPQSPSKRRADTVEQAPCSPSVETLLSATVRRVELEVAKELGGPSDCKKARDERSSPTTTMATTTTAADGRERESAGSAKKLLNNGSDRRSCDGLTSSGSKARKEAAATDSPISSPVTRSQTLDEDATSPRESKQREVTVKCNGTISTKSPISNMLNKLVVVVPKVVVTKMSANCDTNTGTGALVNAKSVSLKAGVANTNINNNNNNNNNHNNNKNMLASEMDERDEKQPKASTKVPPSRLKAADSTSTDVDTSIANNGTSCAKSPKAVGSSRRDGSSESDGSTERTPIKLCRARTDPASLTPTATSNGYGGSSKIEHYNAVTTTTTAPASAELSTPKMTRTMAVNARKLDAGDESVVVVSELISKNDSSSSKGGNDGQGLGGAAAETTLATPTMLTTTTTTTTTTAWSASTSVTTIAAPTITITTTTTLGPTIAKTTTATTATTTTIATPTAAAAAAAAATGTLLTAPTRTTTYSSGGNISSCTPTSAKMRTGRELSAEDVLESTPKKAICGPSAATVRRKDLDTPVLSPVMKDIPENPSSPMTRSMSRRMEETVPGALDSGVGRYMQSNSQTNNSCSNNSSSNSSNNSSNSSSSSSNNSGSTPGLGAATAVLDLDTTAMVDDPAVKKTVRFDRVTVYLFERTQGFTSVPTQGGSTLGMGSTHQDLEEYSVEDHAKRRRAQPRPTSSASDAGAPVVVPISTKRRRELLRRSGVRDIDALEKDECQSIRASRERCGCACQGRCEPMFCLCVLAGIPCQVEVFSQVDRSSFPCGCTQDGCDNPNGRSEFDPVKVKAHVQQTRQRANRELGLPDEQIEPMQCLLENPPCEFFNGEGSDNSSVCSENSDYASSDETPQAAPGEAAPSLSMELEPTSAAAANNNDNNSTSNGTTVQEASEGGMDSDTASINNTASS